MPAVSVIIPCYNLGRYLDEAVESVRAQTFADHEIVIVDDGSTDDDTKALLGAWHKPGTRLIRSENKGLPAAKNLGIANTTGRYICALDADDRLEPTMLEKSVAALEAEPTVAFVSHWLRYFGDATGDWTPADCGFPALLDVNTVNGAALVRRTAVDAVGGYDETFRSGCEDWDFWITLVERGYAGRILPEVLFHYRRREGSMSRAMQEQEGHPALYRKLVTKHLDGYRRHLATLVARREHAIATLSLHVHDLALEHHQWLAPEIAKWRDDVAVLEEKLRRPAGRREPLGPAARLEAAHAEIHALRTSLSWRITAPLRAAYDWWHGVKRGPETP